MMSGTSLDGIDVAIVDVFRRRAGLRIVPLYFHMVPYPPAVRAAILSVSNTMTHTSAISRLNFLLGELYAEAVLKTCKRSKIPAGFGAAVRYPRADDFSRGRSGGVSGASGPQHDADR